MPPINPVSLTPNSPNSPGAVNPPISSLQPISTKGSTTNQNPLPVLSTNQAVQFFMASFMAQIDIGIDIDGGGPTYLDMLDPQIETFIRSLLSTTSIVDDLALPITTLTYRLYGNTSLWWLLLMFNGIIHPLERSAGTLRLFDKNAASVLVSQANSPSLRGTTVEI
jgi:hypothetical protein